MQGTLRNCSGPQSELPAVRGYTEGMDVRSPEAASTAVEKKIAALMATVERLVGERRDAEAQRLLGEAEALSPDHPLVIHARARRLLAGGDALQACSLLKKLVEMAPREVAYWLSLAAALRRLARREEESTALERALALDPRHLIVLLQKAALLDLMNKPRSAAAVYGHALHTLGAVRNLPAPVEAHVRHAEQRVADNAAELSQVIEQRLDDLRAGEQTGGAQRRFDRCLDRMLGRRRIYTPEPTFMLFPYLRNYEFFERECFPWLGALEAATAAIRQEFVQVMNADRTGIEPYIAFEAGLPLGPWHDLNHSPSWGAYFLWNQGRPDASHLARCPHTAAALARVPQVEIAGRAPTAFFSILDARTKIPPHSGVTNTRLTVHLPLVVPAGCRFRVGGEVREWREGVAWVFDDTIEHEAWNDSNLPRAVLIFDVWNPELTQLERDLVSQTTIALEDYYAAEGAVPGVVI